MFKTSSIDPEGVILVVVLVFVLLVVVIMES